MFGDRDHAGNGHMHLSGPVSAAWGKSGFVAWTLQRDRLPIVYLRNAAHSADSSGFRLDQLDLLGAPCIRSIDSRSLRYLLGQAAKDRRVDVQNCIDEAVRGQTDSVTDSTRLVAFIGTDDEATQAERLHQQLALPGAVTRSPVADGQVRISLQIAHPAQIQLFAATGVQPEISQAVLDELTASIESRLASMGMDASTGEGKAAARMLLDEGIIIAATDQAAREPARDHGLSQSTLLDLVSDQYPEAVRVLRQQLAGDRPTPTWWSSPFVVIQVDPEDGDRLAVLLEDLLGTAQSRHSHGAETNPAVLLLEDGLALAGQSASELDHLIRLGRRFGLHVVILDEGTSSPVTANCATRLVDRVPDATTGTIVPWLTVAATGVSRALTRDELHPDLLARGRQAVATSAISPALWSIHA